MKTIEETGKLLLTIQSFDNRSITEEVTKLWHQMLGPYNIADCTQAVMDHYGSSEDWLMPIHVVRRVKSLRARRLALAGDVRLRPEDEFNNDGSLRRDARQRRRQLESAIKDGHLSAEVVEAYVSGSLSYEDAGRLAGARRAALEVTA